MPYSKNPYGIIDDIFEPLGKTAITTVRNRVRKYIKYNELQKKTAAGIRASNAKDVKSAAKRVGRGVPKKPVLKNPNNKRMPVQNLYIREPVLTNPKGTKSAIKTEQAKKRAMSHFSSANSFNKAVREERAAMGLGKKK